jgi:hypothetical protein
LSPGDIGTTREELKKFAVREAEKHIRAIEYGGRNAELSTINRVLDLIETGIITIADISVSEEYVNEKRREREREEDLHDARS